MADRLADVQSSKKSPRPTACTECHIAKVKCDKSFPCSRCVRLSKTCIPHESKQGRGSKKRRRDKDGGAASAGGKVKVKAKKQPKPSPKQSLTEDAISASATSLRPGHFGLRFLIRSWVSFAFRRRSFSLLAKASTLASRVGISMDSILCGESEAKFAPSLLPGGVVGPMDFLLPCLLKPARHQELGSGRLRWTELPPDLLSATRCCVAGRGNGSGYQPKGEGDIETCQNIADVAAVVEEKAEEEILSPILGSRWVFVREMKEGTSRFFVSPAFERDISTWALIQATWVANEREFKSLFLPPSENSAYSRALMHQLNLNDVQGMAPRVSRYGTKIQVKDAGGVASSSFNASTTLAMDVDAVMCMKIVSLDHAFLYVEFLREEVTSANVLASLSDIPFASSSAADEAPGSELNPPWLDLDDLSDVGDLDHLMEVLEACP